MKIGNHICAIDCVPANGHKAVLFPRLNAMVQLEEPQIINSFYTLRATAQPKGTIKGGVHNKHDTHNMTCHKGLLIYKKYLLCFAFMLCARAGLDVRDHGFMDASKQQPSGSHRHLGCHAKMHHKMAASML